MYRQTVLRRVVIVMLVAMALSGCGAVGRVGTWWEQRTERRALVALYRATDGPNWGGNIAWLHPPRLIPRSEWLSGQPVTGIESIDNILGLGSACSWLSVECTNGYVTELDLSYNNLSGAIPPDIGQLRSLESLGLGGNDLTSLPPEIGQLRNLESLDLRYNRLASLPPELGRLQSLRWLFLSGNPLTSLPPEICQMGIVVDIDIRPLCGG